MQVAKMKSLLKDLKQKQSGVKQELKTRLKGALEDKLTAERKAQPKRASEPDGRARERAKREPPKRAPTTVTAAPTQRALVRLPPTRRSDEQAPTRG